MESATLPMTSAKAKMAGAVTFALTLLLQFVSEAVTGQVDTENGIYAFLASLGAGFVTAALTWWQANKLKVAEYVVEEGPEYLS